MAQGLSCRSDLLDGSDLPARHRSPWSHGLLLSYGQCSWAVLAWHGGCWAWVQPGNPVTWVCLSKQTASISGWCFLSAVLWAVIPSAATLWRWHLKRYVLLSSFPPCVLCMHKWRHHCTCRLALLSMWFLRSLAIFSSEMLLEKFSVSCFFHPKHCSFCNITVLCLLWSGAVEASVYGIDLAIIRTTLNKGRY